MVNGNSKIRGRKPKYPLYKYQKEHVSRINNIFKNRPAVVDTSDTGSGKTRCSACLAKLRRFDHVVVICPKSVRCDWWQNFKKINYDDKLLTITNFDTLKAKNITDGSTKWFPLDSKPKTEEEFLSIKPTQCLYMTKGDKEYKCTFPENTLYIIDEFHKCKSVSSYNFKMINAIKQRISNDKTNKSKLLLLSFTPIEKKSDEKVLFYLLDYIINPDAKLVPRFYRKLKKYFRMGRKDPITSFHVHDYLSKSPEKTLVKMNISSYFQEKGFVIKNIIKNLYNNASDADFEKINNLSKKYNELNTKLKNGEDYNLIQLMQKTLQEIEKIKSNYIILKAMEVLEDGDKNHVIIFVNYRRTLHYISDKLKDFNPSKLYGDPKNNNRLESKRFNEDDFNKEGKTRVIISTIGSGATGISLHDTAGDKKRFVFISPSSSSATLIQQSLGRAFRVGTKSDVHQYFIFTKNDKYENENYESILAKTVSKKLEYIKQLRDNPGQHLNGEYKYIDDI